MPEDFGDSRSNSNLSPRAREALEDLLSELREDLTRDARRRSYGGEIGVRDVLEAYDALVEGRWRGSRDGRNRRVLLLLQSYVLASLVLAVVAAVALWGGPSRFGEQLSSGALTSILAVSASLLGVSAALLVTIRSRQRTFQAAEGKERAFGAIVDRWAQIELALRVLAAEALGKSVSEAPVGRLIEELTEAGTLPVSELALRSVLNVRNRVAHGAVVPAPELAKCVREADELLRRLSR